MPTNMFPWNEADDSGINFAASSATPFTASTTFKKLRLTRGSGVVSETDNTISGLGNAGLGGTVQGTSDSFAFISKPLTGVSISGQPEFNIRAAESSTMANYGVGWAAWKYETATDTFSVMNPAFAYPVSLEIGTSEAARVRNSGGTLSSTIANGDRIAVVLVWLSAGGSASGFTATMWFNGTSAAASGDTYVIFAETITEATSSLLLPNRQQAVYLRR